MPLRCSFYSHLAVARLLLSAGADVDAKRISTGTTALHEAAEYDNAEVATMLIDEGGADIESRTFREHKKDWP